MKYKRGEEICNFCGCVCGSRSVVSNYDDSVYVCDRCILDCYNLLDKHHLLPYNKTEDNDFEFNYKPKEIVKMLNKYIIGQEEAKKTLAVSVYNHYKRIRLAKRNIFVQKSNVLLLGPTGSGKTHLLKTLAQILDVPFMIVDSSQITPSGYKGDDLSNSWLRLYNKCGRSTSKMKNAIIYFDEIDKLIFRNESTDDFYGAAQSEFLKILEDSEISFTDNRDRSDITVDSSNMLFVFGGAFAGLEKIIEKRLGIEKKSVIGFNNTNEVKKDTNILSKVTLDDLREFGVSPEFMGRISSVVTLNALTEQDLVDILVKPKNSIISQYKAMFLEDGVSLDFEEGAVKSIAKKAIEKETGARGLKAIIEDKMLNLMYELPSDNKIVSCTITKSFMEGKTKKPKLVKYEENKVLKINH